MADKKRKTKKDRRVRMGFLMKVLLLVLLASIGWQLLRLRGEVADAQAQRDALSAEVEAKRQENGALQADIDAGGTQEKIEEIAREELGLVSPGDYVFPDGID